MGQGLAGTLLAYELQLRSKKILVIDEGEAMTSSKIAAGLYNPVTGRKMVKTWMADELFPSLPKYYTHLEGLTGARFHFPISIYRPFTGMEEQNDWQSKTADDVYRRFVSEFHQRSVGIEGVLDSFGGLVLNYSGYVELVPFLEAMGDFFKEKGMLSSQLFQYERLEENVDCVTYDQWQAKWIVFCEGPRVADNPFFRSLRFRFVKGELLGVKTDVEFKHIVNRGVFMIPKERFLQVGSTYDHRSLDWSPTRQGMQELEERLKKLYASAYTIVDRRAGVRPATFDRRPFVGMLKKSPRIGIFNGLGTKGVSLGPHFAQLMTRHLLDGTPLPEEVSIER